jgi:LytR cell envelope-related transcriptional attenuator
VSVGQAVRRSGGRYLCVLLLIAGCGDRTKQQAFPIPGENGGRIVVEVLNASGRPGLARSATRALRQAGIDVVAFGNATPDLAGVPVDSTRILIRRGSAVVGDRIRQVLLTGKVISDPDTTRLVDASVLLGADFRPRAELHP